MKPDRATLYSIGLTVALNLILFILCARFLYLGPLHHHWVFTVQALVLGVQYAAFTHLKNAPARSSIEALMALLGLMAAVRWETISTCSGHCVPKVGLGLVVAGASFVYGWRVDKAHTPYRRLVLGAGLLLIGTFMNLVK